MRKRAAISATALLVALAGVAASAPAYAEDTDVTIEIEGGTLSISAPTGPVVTTPITAAIAAQTVDFSLGEVTVTDAVGGTAGWGISAAVTPFSLTVAEGADAVEIPVTDATYTVGTIATEGTVTATPATDIVLDGATAVVTGTATGVNTATWNPTISVPIPAGALSGTYTSTVTHSIL